MLKKSRLLRYPAHLWKISKSFYAAADMALCLTAMKCSGAAGRVQYESPETLGDRQTCEAVVSICRHISVAACYVEHANLSIVASIEGLLPMWLHVYGPDWT